MTDKITVVKDSVPCTPEEIKAQMQKLQKQYDEDMKNPHIFWREMGIDYVGQ